VLNLRNEHQKLTDAGWSYRANDRGWVIYRDPQTGHWHPRLEAIGIVEPFEPAKGATGSGDSRPNLPIDRRVQGFRQADADHAPRQLWGLVRNSTIWRDGLQKVVSTQVLKLYTLRI
jgi:hypothetical protein